MRLHQYFTRDPRFCKSALVDIVIDGSIRRVATRTTMGLRGVALTSWSLQASKALDLTTVACVCYKTVQQSVVYEAVNEKARMSRTSSDDGSRDPESARGDLVEQPQGLRHHITWRPSYRSTSPRGSEGLEPCKHGHGKVLRRAQRAVSRV